MIDMIGSDRVILETINGGYLLNGNFHYGTGTAGGGYMEDLDGLAMSMFSANGQLNLSQAKVFASGWRQSAGSMGRGASTQELLANLRAFQQQSVRYADELANKPTVPPIGADNIYGVDNQLAGQQRMAGTAFTARTSGASDHSPTNRPAETADERLTRASKNAAEVAKRSGASAGRYAGMAVTYNYPEASLDTETGEPKQQASQENMARSDSHFGYGRGRRSSRKRQ